MSELKELQAVQKELDAKKMKAEKELKTKIAEQYQLEYANIGIVNSDFISIKTDEWNEFLQVVKLTEVTSPRIVKHGQDEYQLDHYTTIKNSFDKIELTVQMNTNIGMVWVTIDFKNIPKEFKEAHFRPTKRKLYSTESHYVSLPFHYKKVQEMRIPAYESLYQQLSWFGGDKTIIDESFIELCLM